MKNLLVFFLLFFLLRIEQLLGANLKCGNPCNPHNPCGACNVCSTYSPTTQIPDCQGEKKPKVDVHSLIKDLISKEETAHELKKSNTICKIIATILGILATVATIAAGFMAYRCISQRKTAREEVQGVTYKTKVKVIWIMLMMMVVVVVMEVMQINQCRRNYGNFY
ncbi:circumsporozoite-related antigen (CRA), putative [Hepatocystis sp. ex Piliocolobus tephrosceles]|nr:circumsporozoite-related antigen (CRA), putative [Hepatocystis sp. ex Piliocolobus tephrosceles]